MAVDLNALDQDYQETPAATDNPPDGLYQCQIKTAEVKDTKNGDYKMLALKTSVLIGPHHGSTVFVNIVITGTPDNLRFVKRDLLKLGYNGPLSQLQASCETFLDKCIEVKVQTKKNRDGNENTNVYLQKAIDVPKGIVGSAGPSANFAPPPPEDEIPF